jgi:hypothetical protein
MLDLDSSSYETSCSSTNIKKLLNLTKEPDTNLEVIFFLIRLLNQKKVK